MRIIDDIINKEVVNTHATTIGIVVDVEFDTANNTIESLIIVDTDGHKKDSDESHIPFEDVRRIGDTILIKSPSKNNFI